MNKFLELFLGILTAMGGFVEIGELTFAINTGSKFHYQLLWLVLVGTVRNHRVLRDGRTHRRGPPTTGV